jgi:NADPH2:quinone reductase
MKAICCNKIGIENIVLKGIKRPKIKPEHVLIKISACAINHGDLAWFQGQMPGGIPSSSVDDVAGVCGVGEVIEIGENVPDAFQGNEVTFYRGLHPTDFKVGAWCEYALMHYLDCVLLPNNCNVIEYSGSLVNIVNAYAFAEHANINPEKAVIATAGESLTGRALLGVAHEKKFPVISIVRNESEKQRLEELNPEYILVQNDNNFEEQFESLSQELNVTAVYDGVGGPLITRIIPLLPSGSTVFSYGFLAYYAKMGGVNFDTTTLFVKKLTLTSYGVVINETVRNKEKLKIALDDIKDFVHLPHFKTEIGQLFALEEYKEALEYSTNLENKGKAVITF